MIELPEANVLARQISQTLTGRRIVRSQANQTPHKFAWYSGDPASYPAMLDGQVIGEARGVGNHVEIDTTGSMLAISTPIRLHQPGDKLPKKHQLLLELDDGSAVTCTVQMWGAMQCLQPGQQSELMDYPLALVRPSPLSEAFDRAYFDSLCGENSAGFSAKAFLATEQRIPGLGNGVLQDILWTAQIHPRRKMGSLKAAEMQAMFRAVKDVLAEMAAQGGRDTEPDLFGNPGGYHTVLSKNTLGQPCPACQALIRKEAYMGGSVYFCLGCQPLI